MVRSGFNGNHNLWPGRVNFCSAGRRISRISAALSKTYHEDFSPLAPADAMFRFQALAFRLARARDSGCYPAGS